MPKRDDKLTIGYFTGTNWIKFAKIGETKAWNFHQGCRLQWLGNEDILAYNDTVADQIITKLYNLKDHATKQLDDGTYCASINGNYLYHLDFQRIGVMHAWIWVFG